jgi:serine/threonine-protein kinase RsbW
MGQPHSASFPARIDAIRSICAFMIVGAKEAGFKGEELFRIELACDEACTNIIQHAYGGIDSGEIAVSWKVDTRSFVMVFRDRGRAFNPDEVPSPNVPLDRADIDKLRIGGLGLHFMRQLMDEVRFEFDPRQGNLLIMIKKRPKDDGR